MGSAETSDHQDNEVCSDIALPPSAPRNEIDIGMLMGKADGGVTINAGDRLKFARQILFFLFVFSVLVIGAYLINPESKSAPVVFEFVKIGVLPLVTLVIGFYFPNNTK